MTDRIARAVFGRLFESSTEVVLVVDRVSGLVLSANVPATELLAYELGALIGRPFEDLVHDRDRDITAAGHYEDLALRRSDDYPVYVELEVVHVDDPHHGAMAAYIARDTTEKRTLQLELLAKHSALVAAYGELERTNRRLTEATAELERRNSEIASLSFRVTLGEVVAGIAHHLNNPVAALTSSVARLQTLLASIEHERRPDVDKVLSRVARVTARIESNVAAIVEASRSASSRGARPLGVTRPPPELASELSSFADRLDDIPTKESA